MMADQVSSPAVETKAPEGGAQETAAIGINAGESESSAKEQSAPETVVRKEESNAADEAKAAETANEIAEKDASKPAGDGDVDMKDATEVLAQEADQPIAAAPSAPATKAKDRRKSTGEGKGKGLNKKGSKARMLHTDAKPGDHFLVKLKGFPAWPAIICDEAMLPEALITSRPVTAARPDGTYAEAYADGGKRVYDRTFPVMYLYTNEFGWASNSALTDLTPEKAKTSVTDKMRKDLKAAFELAAEHHSIDHYKKMLQQIMDDLIAEQEAQEAANTPKKSKKGKGKTDEDVEMEDSEDGSKSKSKKRKAEDDTSTPQRSDSVKKPKIKLNTSSTPKAANGPGGAAAKDESSAKTSKTKPKKTKEGGEKKSETPKETKMTPEERHARKEKEVLYLRHKLQRGLLTRDQQPQESEMKQMADFLTMLENMQDLEVSIIRATKINKVLKAILKLESIPRETDFKFKSRSQTLLDKWNKLMATDTAPASGTNVANGVNGSAESRGEDKKAEPNGVKSSSEQAKIDETKPVEPAATETATKDKAPSQEESEDKAEKPSTEATALPTEVAETAA